jgi:hypothetical protein
MTERDDAFLFVDGKNFQAIEFLAGLQNRTLGSRVWSGRGGLTQSVACASKANDASELDLWPGIIRQGSETPAKQHDKSE